MQEQESCCALPLEREEAWVIAAPKATIARRPFLSSARRILFWPSSSAGKNPRQAVVAGGLERVPLEDLLAAAELNKANPEEDLHVHADRTVELVVGIEDVRESPQAEYDSDSCHCGQLCRLKAQTNTNVKTRNCKFMPQTWNQHLETVCRKP